MPPPAPPGGDNRHVLLQRCALLDHGPDHTLQQLLTLLCAQLAAPAALIALLDAGTLRPRAGIGVGSQPQPYPGSCCQQVISHNSPLLQADSRTSCSHLPPQLADGQAAVSYLGVPLLLPPYGAIGTLCLLDQQPRSYRDTELRLLQSVAETVSGLLQQRLQLQQQRKQLAALRATNAAQALFLQQRDLGSACRQLLAPLLRSSECTLGFIGRCVADETHGAALDIPCLLQHDAGALSWLLPQLASHGDGYRLPGFEHPLARAMFEGEALVINQPWLYGDHGLAQLSSLLALPCLFHGVVEGLLVLANRSGGFDGDCVQQLEAVADDVGTLLYLAELEQQRAHREAELARLNTQDALTGLPSRRAFLESCQLARRHALRYHHHYSVLRLDLETLPQLNRQLGHAAGDYALTAFGQLLQKQLRDTDQAARWGGESFCVLLPQEEAAQALRLSERLCQAVEQLSLYWHGQPLPLSTSIGVATTDRDDESVDTLLARADGALQSAKRQHCRYQLA